MNPSELSPTDKQKYLDKNLKYVKILLAFRKQMLYNETDTTIRHNIQGKPEYKKGEKTMEKYVKPIVEVEKLENDVILTSETTTATTPNDPTTGTRNVYVK